MNSLSSDDVARIRRQFLRRHHPVPAQGASVHRFIGGPLDGLTLKIDAPNARCDFIGVCHLTSSGLVQLIYRRTDAGVMQFEETEWPRHRLDRVAANPFEKSVSPRHGA